MTDEIAAQIEAHAKRTAVTWSLVLTSIRHTLLPMARNRRLVRPTPGSNLTGVGTSGCTTSNQEINAAVYRLNPQRHQDWRTGQYKRHSPRSGNPPRMIEEFRIDWRVVARRLEAGPQRRQEMWLAKQFPAAFIERLFANN